jgi:hypothetical protein
MQIENTVLFCAARDIQEKHEEIEKCADAAGAGPCKEV